MDRMELVIVWKTWGEAIFFLKVLNVSFHLRRLTKEYLTSGGLEPAFEADRLYKSFEDDIYNYFELGNVVNMPVFISFMLWTVSSIKSGWFIGLTDDLEWR